MLGSKIHNFGKGIKKFVDNKIQACKEILSSAQNRLILGLIIFGAGIGIGGGLIASAYLSPQI
jgi:hypothetical protein